MKHRVVPADAERWDVEEPRYVATRWRGDAAGPPIVLLERHH